MFYTLCITSTLTATVIEDLSVIIIFIPIVIIACRDLKRNPAPFLFGITICINLASTLTPFGSPQNVMIANSLNKNLGFFLLYLGPYFLFTTILTLIFLDIFVLKRSGKKEYLMQCQDFGGSPVDNDKNSDRKATFFHNNKTSLDNIKDLKPNIGIECSDPVNNSVEKEQLASLLIDRKTLIKNFIGLGLFIIALFIIHEIYAVALVAMVMFAFLNPRKDNQGKKGPRLSYFLSKIDYKLIYFFICLFIMVELMILNKTVDYFEKLIENLSPNNIFLLSVTLLIITSLLSGFLDNAPVTIIFLPIINILTNTPGISEIPLIIALVLGINLGGNFLPQGSAADMMTLELANKHCVKDVNFKSLTKIGGIFASFHVLLGIIYLAVLIFIV